MITKVQRWGNSLAVRIPKALADELHLGDKADVDLDLQDGTLIIRPARRHKYSLTALLAQITPDNVHEEVDWGPSVGNEIVP